MAGSGRKDLASALIITEVLAQDFNDQMTLNIKNPMVALFTFINCLSKLLKAKLYNPARRGYLFPFCLGSILWRPLSTGYFVMLRRSMVRLMDN